MSNYSTNLHRCWAEVDLSALRHNADLAREQSGAEIMAIVKANAYGHGAVAVAKALADKATMFGVANLHEAEELLNGGITQPIFLLGACLPEEAEGALRLGFHVCINTLEEAMAINELAEKLETKAHVHLVMDTGMGRLGFLEEEWNEAIFRELLQHPNLIWEGIGSHLPSSDEDAEFTHRQIERFRQCVAQVQAWGLHPRWIHLSNSGGIFGYQDTRNLCNLARPGLLLYGVNPLFESGLEGENTPAKPALTWKARVSLVRQLPIGHGVSYGQTFITKRPTKVATLSCGYADGYPRQVNGKGAEVLIHGKRCPVLGRVTMDQIMVDVTDLAETPKIGAEAVILGRQGDEEISANEIAQKAGTISWHIFTSIGERVGRSYVG